MPIIPTVVNRQPISGQQAVIPGPDFFGAGIGRALTDSGQVFERIQAGADAAETTKLVGEGTAGLADALQGAKLQHEDPEAYQQAAKDAIQTTYEAALD